MVPFRVGLLKKLQLQRALGFELKIHLSKKVQINPKEPQQEASLKKHYSKNKHNLDIQPFHQSDRL